MIRVHLPRRVRAMNEVQIPGMTDDRGSKWSVGSQNSILSIGSKGSILSVGSVGSILSVGSAGSLLSVGSLGSAASVGSILSAGSLGSILSALSSRSILAWRSSRTVPGRAPQARLGRARVPRAGPLRMLALAPGATPLSRGRRAGRPGR